MRGIVIVRPMHPWRTFSHDVDALANISSDVTNRGPGSAREYEEVGHR